MGLNPIHCILIGPFRIDKLVEGPFVSYGSLWNHIGAIKYGCELDVNRRRLSVSGPCALEAERLTSPPPALFICNAKVCNRTTTLPSRPQRR